MLAVRVFDASNLACLFCCPGAPWNFCLAVTHPMQLHSALRHTEVALYLDYNGLT